ncbi:FdtA/QdtA family cupin domain-containing protein [Agarivorans aestuarii]|uniref:FdtA/QdtA family cupin domain-containing protein n=1 Tax=Agarivorans aestuarii TaxID=1563703 RepID=A0ABU7GC27_9ALTE|nr:FdtA/QdtA family cupin domain-containing protein [Agarivorans aestuarii]MEE1676030.1 FdtA/QdtA family cupin domain-containing protein [Agarivorans aestuarii]
MSLIKVLNFKPLGDDRGDLVALEELVDIPFAMKRVYYVFRTERGVSRGFHAHKNLKQVAVCVTGSCDFLLDDGTTRETITLDSSTKGILIEGIVWREMHNFSDDCVLMVIASEHYDESDYIRNYDNFLKIANKN